ncbi:hypothetical protein Hanom_Chr16g01460241 [Helianthus anomalus]
MVDLRYDFLPSLTFVAGNLTSRDPFFWWCKHHLKPPSPYALCILSSRTRLCPAAAPPITNN